jgi:hypothetical protein
MDAAWELYGMKLLEYVLVSETMVVACIEAKTYMYFHRIFASLARINNAFNKISPFCE